jgi:hypothetical protein
VEHLRHIFLGTTFEFQLEICSDEGGTLYDLTLLSRSFKVQAVGKKPAGLVFCRARGRLDGLIGCEGSAGLMA